MIGAVHTSTIAGFWSIFRCGVVGTFHKVSRKHMPLYVAEFHFRYDNRANADTLRTQAARASCLPALRPAREVHRCDRTGGACGYVRFSLPPFGKPGPTLSPGDESPFGENRGGTPAGERARKRRAAQAASPWRVPHAACVRA